MSGPNRSIRRKPPPPLDEYTPEIPPNLPRDSPNFAGPSFLTPENNTASFQTPQKSEKKQPSIPLTINADLSYGSAYGSAHGQEKESYADFADYAEDSLLSYESPRLKGPQILMLEELGSDFSSPVNSPVKSPGHAASEPSSPLFLRRPPGFLAPLAQAVPPRPDPQNLSPSGSILSHKSSSYRQRRFQNLSQKGTSPLKILDSDEEEGPDYFDKYTPRSKHASVHTPSPKNLPYPVSDAFSSDEDPCDISANDTFENIHTNRPAARTTPTRIPSLVEKDSMKISPHHSLSNQSPSHPSLSHRTSSPELRFLRSSPPRLINSPSTSPESPQNPYLSSPSSSPTRVSLYGRSPQTYSGVVSDSRSSRSPSPKKFGASSPGSKPSLYPYHEDYSDVFEDYYNQGRVPRWSLIEKDGFDYFDDSFIMPPAANHFDYTILPELPKWSEEPLDKSVFAPPPQSTLSLRRKNDSLPPVPLNLPSLPFSPSALSAFHFSACSNVWSLSSIFAWCLELKKWIHGQAIPLKDLKKTLMRLITFHRQLVPIDLISRNVAHIIDLFTTHKLLVPDTSIDKEDKPKLLSFHFNDQGSIGGVLVDFTSCYCVDEDHKSVGRKDFLLKCYSSQCSINKTIDHEFQMRTTNIEELVLGVDWASHWKLSAQDMAIDLSESKKQSFLFDLIKFEQNFIQRAECFLDVAGPEFIKLAKLMVGTSAPGSMKDFENKVLTAAKDLLTIHQTLLYEPLLKILVSDGKFVKDLTGIAALYKAWANAAKTPLLAYISAVPMIEDLLSNSAFKRWDESIRANKRIKELQVNGNLLLMSTFNSRYQQLPLQLEDVRKSFDEEDEEYQSLTEAISAIRQLGSKVNEMKVHSDNVHALRLVERQLAWKSSVTPPRLNLKSSRRKLFYRGDLVRKGDLKINSSSVHAIVLDNYVLITEKQRGQKLNNYKVTETPIPLDYLIVENREKEAHGLSVKPSTANTSVQIDEEAHSFPFKIRYAGRGKGESHTLITSTEKERKRWINILMQARVNLLKRVSPATPFKFELVENAYFSYETGSRMLKLPLMCPTDPISILAKETSSVRSSTGRSSSVQRNIQCSETFSFVGETFVFLGTTSGVYCSDRKNIWKKIINMNNVAKVTVLAELNVVLVLAGKTLRYYPLQSLINIYYEKMDRITSYQLSNEGILFYEYGRHRGLPMLFVAKKKTAALTSFKVFVLETDNNGIFSAFTVYKRFIIQSECHGISVFNSSIAVHTHKGFEVLDLQKLVPRSVPELPQSDSSTKKLDGYSRKKVVPSADALRKILAHAIPMGMYKITNNREFLMVYNDCAVFANKSGKLSRTSAVCFNFRPKSVAFKDDNLFLICEEVIEVWSISGSADGTNTLVQVIPSKDLHILDPSTLCFKSASPETPDSQIVFQMLVKPDETFLKSP